VVEELLEVLAGNIYAGLKLGWFLEVDQLLDLFHSLADTWNSCVLLKLSNESLRLLDIPSAIIGAVNKELVEKITSPFDTVLNLAGEVTKGTHRDSLLRRVLRVSVALSLVRDYHLWVCLGAKSARLEERLGIPDAAGVDVETSLNVINSIDNEVEVLPEVVIEDILGLLRDIGLVVSHIQIAVDFFGNVAGDMWLGVSHVVLTEQELSVKVGDLNIVVIGDSDLTLLGAANTHESEGLDIFTAESSSSNHESLHLSEFLLDFASINENLIVVAAVKRSAVSCSTRKSLEDVIMQPLLKGRILACILHDLLSDDTTEEGSHGWDACLRIESGIADYFFIKFLDKETLGIFVGWIDGLSVSENSLEVLIIVSWKTTSILLLELPDTAECDMKLFWAAEESQIWGLKHPILRGSNRVVDALLQAVISDLLRHFNVLNQTLTDVGIELGGINVYLEAESINDGDLSGWKGVQLCHALDFIEFNIVAILELVSLVLMNSHDERIGLSSINDNEWLGVLTICISNAKIVSIVEEGKASGTIGLGENEANAFSSAELVDFDEFFYALEYFCVADNMECSVVFKRERSSNLDLNVWVKLLELLVACLSAGHFTYMILSAVEVARKISPCYGVRIVESHWLWPSEDQVLCSLDTGTTEANN
jgi:hypothetical protein